MSRVLSIVLLLIAVTALAGCATPGAQANAGLRAHGLGSVGDLPTPEITPSAAPTMTATATPSPTTTSSPAPTYTPTPSPTATTTPSPVPSATATSMPTATSDPAAQINGIPASSFIWMPPETQANIRAIFEHGQKLERDPHAFSKLGDSLSLIAYYLVWFDQQRYDLGPYAELQPTIDFYHGSFQRFGVAVRNGLHTWAAFHKGEADPVACLPEEHMLECEFRQHNPSVLLVRLGTNDNGVDDSFERAIRYTIEYSIKEGVIPVLSTKADRFEGEDNRNNRTLRKLAAEYNVPLWDFDRLAATLPGRGLGKDNVHLTSAPLNDYADPATFDYGFPVNDLAALMMLDSIRLVVESALPEGPLP